MGCGGKLIQTNNYLFFAMATHREMFWGEAGEGGRRLLGVTMKSRHGSQRQCREYLRNPVLEGSSGRDKDWWVDRATSRLEGAESHLGGPAIKWWTRRGWPPCRFQAHSRHFWFNVWLFLSRKFRALPVSECAISGMNTKVNK